jgi:homoserine dehydrogenase
MTAPVRLGIAGLGTVGTGVVKIVQRQANLLARRCGRRVEITAVSARSRDKDRGVSITAYAWEDDPVALACREDVDVFVELMGGEDGPAKAATEAAIARGKHVVTANKAMLAHHGQALAEAAEAAGVNLRFEAAVAGGIPVVKALTEGLAGNAITRIMGVMNGTCNYILTRMDDAGLTYEEAFAEADGLGYLEADPELDVGGIDAGHKLSAPGVDRFRHARGL